MEDKLADLDLVHDRRDNDISPTTLSSLRQRIPSSRYWYSMSIRIHMFPDNVIFTADQYSRWALEAI